MRLLWLLLVIAVPVMFSGCSATSGDFHQIAQDERVPYSGRISLSPPKDAEKVLKDGFYREMNISWIPGQKEEALLLLGAIESQFQYMKTRKDATGSLPYYVYRGGFELIQYSYLKLEEILDNRVAQNVLTVPEKVVYDLIKRDIKIKLELESDRINRAEENINKKASEQSIENIRRTYDILKPIIELAL